MPIDLEKLGGVLAALFIGSSTLLLTAAIAWGEADDEGDPRASSEPGGL